jgi:hypothetical protein
MRRHLAALLMLTLAGTACGGSDGPAGPGGLGGPNNGTFTARIDNTSWAATIILPAYTDIAGGASGIGAGSPTFTVSWAHIDNQQPGTYTIGQSIGFNASVTQGSAMWAANAQQGSGTLSITTRTPNRVAGTFSFTMPPAPGSSATGTKQITNGQFDVTL